MHLPSPFSVIVEDFDQELTSLELLVKIGQGRTVVARTRVASIHATTLMLAAAFEEFVREMAREYAKHVVRQANSVSELPEKLVVTAWRRTLSELARVHGRGRSRTEVIRMSAKQTRPTVDALCSFVEGDIGQDIYEHLVHNENSMRAGEINKMFRIGGLRNVCLQVCAQTSLQEFFRQEDQRLTHQDFLAELENFIDRRNEIAHSLNSGISSAPEEVFRVIGMLRAFAKDLGLTLEIASL